MAGSFDHRLAAVIVDYDSGEALRQCVASCLDEGIEEIVVVDNSPRASATVSLGDLVSYVTVLWSGRNLGYGAGVNLGASQVSSEYLLCANADVALHRGAAKALLDVLDSDPSTAIVGPVILDEHGEIYPSARRFPGIGQAIGHAFVGLVWPSNPWTAAYTMADWDHSKPARVDWVSGACFMARTDAWESLGGFDESYFMYAEDVDLCWRAARAGWSVRYEPSGTATHIQGLSTRSHPWRMSAAHHRSLFRFAARSTEGPARLLLPAQAAGLATRFVLTRLLAARSNAVREPSKSAPRLPGR